MLRTLIAFALCSIPFLSHAMTLDDPVDIITPAFSLNDNSAAVTLTDVFAQPALTSVTNPPLARPLIHDLLYSLFMADNDADDTDVELAKVSGVIDFTSQTAALAYKMHLAKSADQDQSKIIRTVPLQTSFSLMISLLALFTVSVLADGFRKSCVSRYARTGLSRNYVRRF